MAAPKTVKVDPGSMDREQLLAELARVQAELAAAPAAQPQAVKVSEEATLGLDDIAPPWMVPQELCGRDLLRDGISAYVPDGSGKNREFVPGQFVRGVTMAVKQNVLATLSVAADQYRQNQINRGAIVQNAPMEFDA